MAYNQTIQNEGKLQPVSMFVWRTTRRENEKRVESVNRELLHRQHAN
jgi:hypothetical protein